VDIEGETIDISMNGTLVSVPQTLPLGSLVQISIRLLDGMKPIVGRGSVVRVVGRTQMGILLDQLSVAESGRLQDYLLPRIAEKNPPTKSSSVPAPHAESS
jgi:hypothetical protein